MSWCVGTHDPGGACVLERLVLVSDPSTRVGLRATRCGRVELWVAEMDLENLADVDLLLYRIRWLRGRMAESKLEARCVCPVHDDAELDDGGVVGWFGQREDAEDGRPLPAGVAGFPVGGRR